METGDNSLLLERALAGFATLTLIYVLALGVADTSRSGARTGRFSWPMFSWGLLYQGFIFSICILGIGWVGGQETLGLPWQGEVQSFDWLGYAEEPVPFLVLNSGIKVRLLILGLIGLFVAWGLSESLALTVRLIVARRFGDLGRELAFISAVSLVCWVIPILVLGLAEAEYLQNAAAVLPLLIVCAMVLHHGIGAALTSLRDLYRNIFRETARAVPREVTVQAPAEVVEESGGAQLSTELIQASFEAARETVAIERVLADPTSAKLSIEVVPQGQWGANVRNGVSNDEWDVLRKATYRRADYRCEICDGRGEAHPVECHERWFYDDMANVQSLVGLIALCPSCHEVKHFGLACKMGNRSRALNHLMKINGWNAEVAEAYVEAIQELWAKRSAKTWTLNLGWLASQGMGVPAKPPEGREFPDKVVVN